METNTPLFYVLQVFGMCETTFPGCGTTCVWECCFRVGCSITARVPTSDPSCQEGQLTCRWASSTWGDLGSLHTEDLRRHWEQHFFFWPWGHPQQPQYLFQVSSAPLYSLYFLRITLCVSYRYAYMCSTCLSGALEEADGSVELQMVVSCYVGTGN